MTDELATHYQKKTHLQHGLKLAEDGKYVCKRLAAQMQKRLHQYIDLECVLQLCGRFHQTAKQLRRALAAYSLQQVLGQLGTGQQLINVLKIRIRRNGQQRRKGDRHHLDNVLIVAEAVGKVRQE